MASNMTEFLKKNSFAKCLKTSTERFQRPSAPADSQLTIHNFQYGDHLYTLIQTIQTYNAP